MAALLDQVADDFATNFGILAKRELGLVSEVFGASDWVSGPGDDAAAVPLGQLQVLAAGEAIFPPFVAADPFGAGVAAVVANVNDIAAMGGRCLGIVDTVVAPRPLARTVLEGLRHAAGLYGVPVLGGHLTVRDGPPAVSAFAIGSARALLAARNAADGQALLLACCVEGRLRDDFPFFPSYEVRGARLPGDLDLFPRLAETGDCVAAKDVSMGGLLGSLGMLLEPSLCGVTLDLDALPCPPGVPLERWLTVFPSYAFLLTSPPASVEAARAAFRDRGLACEQVGVLDDSGELRVRLGGGERTLLDLAAESVTRLAPPD